MHIKPATLLKVTFLHVSFSLFLNCTISTKSRKTLHVNITYKKLLVLISYPVFLFPQFMQTFIKYMSISVPVFVYGIVVFIKVKKGTNLNCKPIFR